MKTQYHAVFFDLDGTLMDTKEDLIPCIENAIKAHNYPLAPRHIIQQHISEGSRQMIAFGANLNINDPRIDPILKTFQESYRHWPLKNIYFSGIETILERLEQEHTPWGIITNKSTLFAETLVEKAKLKNRIIALVCGDTLPYAKPHPDPILYACAKAQIEPKNALYLGDSPNDIQAAKQAGMPSGACLWGYLPENPKPTKWGANYLFENPKQLEQHLWQKHTH